MVTVLGDIHGNFKPMLSQIKKFDLRNSNVIQVGDFGIGFETNHKELKRLKFLNESFKSRNNKLFVIRGNHDDPKYFDGSYKLSNVELLKDNSVISIDGINILLLGGAISVDRSDRNENTSYWKDEKFILNKELLSTLKNIDCVISHPSIRDYSKVDTMLPHEIATERLDLKDAFDILKENNTIKYWCSGHYHFSFKNEFQNTTFIGLAIDELKELRF